MVTDHRSLVIIIGVRQRVSTRVGLPSSVAARFQRAGPWERPQTGTHFGIAAARFVSGSLVKDLGRPAADAQGVERQWP